MKQNVILQKLCVIVIAMLLLSTASFAITNSDSKQIPLKDHFWQQQEKDRSLFSPFTAYYDESILTIRNEKPACDLTITLTDVQTGSSVYTMEVSQENSAFITIPLDGLGRGEYCLTISHPEAGYVYGTFNL